MKFQFLAGLLAVTSAYTNTAKCRKYTEEITLAENGFWQTWTNGPLFTIDILDEKTLKFTVIMAYSQVFGINFSEDFN